MTIGAQDGIPSTVVSNRARHSDFTDISAEECVIARHDIETLVGLDEYYAIEEETVEERKWGER